ncbi:hypothetical protein SGPA1_50140 [Streptomyces misionensis JCM 4497]
MTDPVGVPVSGLVPAADDGDRRAGPGCFSGATRRRGGPPLHPEEVEPSPPLQPEADTASALAADPPVRGPLIAWSHDHTRLHQRLGGGPGVPDVLVVRACPPARSAARRALADREPQRCRGPAADRARQDLRGLGADREPAGAGRLCAPRAAEHADLAVAQAPGGRVLLRRTARAGAGARRRPGRAAGAARRDVAGDHEAAGAAAGHGRPQVLRGPQRGADRRGARRLGRHGEVGGLAGARQAPGGPGTESGEMTVPAAGWPGPHFPTP